MGVKVAVVTLMLAVDLLEKAVEELATYLVMGVMALEAAVHRERAGITSLLAAQVSVVMVVLLDPLAH